MKPSIIPRALFFSFLSMSALAQTFLISPVDLQYALFGLILTSTFAFVVLQNVNSASPIAALQKARELKKHIA